MCVCVCLMLARKIAPKIFNLFQTFFSFFFKQIKEIGMEGFGKRFKRSLLPLHFFICLLYFIGVGGDENLKFIWCGLTVRSKFSLGVHLMLLMFFFIAPSSKYVPLYVNADSQCIRSRGDFCRLLIAFANSWDPEPNRLTLGLCS